MCERRVNDRKVGALGCYPPRRERERERKTLEGCGEGGGQREREKEGFERIGSDLLSRSYPLPPSLASPSSWPAKRINTDHVVCSGNAERTADPNPRACNNLSQPLNIYIYNIFPSHFFSLLEEISFSLSN